MPLMVVDPRIPPARQEKILGTRRESMSGRKVMLFDNGKMGSDYGPYSALFERVSAALRSRFDDVEVIHYSEDLLRAKEDRLEDLARWIADQDVSGVVFALCDWGVSQPTAILAARLEALNVPTTIIATPVGTSQVLANAAQMAPGLPVTTIQSLRSASQEAMVAEADQLVGEILDGLLLPVSELRERFDKRPINAPAPASESGLLEITGEDSSAEFTEAMRASQLGDGLPLVAPTREKVEQFLAAASERPDDRIWPVIPPRSTAVTAQEVAAVAVAAGCEPTWAPIVFAAYRAMAAPEFRLFQGAITTHPGGTLVFVSGPDAQQYGFASGRGALGPGFPANATTGRAIALGYSFLLGAIPGGADLTAQGSPAQYAYCCAENLTDSPWDGLHASQGFPDQTTVTVLKCEGPHNVLDQQSTDPAQLLLTVASCLATLGSNAAYVTGAETMVMLNPEHARLLAEAGWTKFDVAEFLFDAARNPREDLRGRGIGPIWPTWFDSAPRVPVTARVEDLLITVAGGAGPASQVAIPWGYSRAVTRPITS